MNGSEAKAAFDQAKSLVIEGRLAEAQDVHLLPSDRRIIDRMITSRAAGNVMHERCPYLNDEGHVSHRCPHCSVAEDTGA